MNSATRTGPAPAAPAGGIELFRVFGVRIRVDPSWFLIFALILATLAFGHFPRVAPGEPAASYWLAGGLAALLFFGSILAHELAHSLVALRAGIPVTEITLFLFGGVSRMQHEPRRPATEVAVAIAGPLASFALAGLFAALAWASRGAAWLTTEILAYLGWVNLAIGTFNLLPGFPLDGGRVLRALVWWKTDSLRRGTRVASNAGQALAIALMVLGALEIAAGALVGGLWLILIALFLRSLARAGYRELVLRGLLEGVEVERVMVPREELVTVPPELTLRQLVDDYLLGLGHRAFPVVEGGRTLGLVSSEDVRRVPKDAWSATTVRQAMTPLQREATVAPDDSMLVAVQRLQPAERKRLLVMHDGELDGLLSHSDVTRFVELHSLTASG
jgi:Zn-dependent protease/CBS domain-containing protein